MLILWVKINIFLKNSFRNLTNIKKFVIMQAGDGDVF